MKKETILYAKKLLEEHGDHLLFLDTETTGLSNSDEVIELGIVDINGKVIFDQRFKPSVPIHPKAQEVHRISAEMLENEPAFFDYLLDFIDEVSGKKMLIFNKDYDTRIIRQNIEKFENTDAISFMQAFMKGIQSNIHCAMKMAANVFGATNKYGSISLSNAAIAAGLNPADYKAHSAVGDCLMTKDLFLAIAKMELSND